MTSINAAAGAVGGTVVATVNVELGKLAGGKFSLLEPGGAPITMHSVFRKMRLSLVMLMQ